MPSYTTAAYDKNTCPHCGTNGKLALESSEDWWEDQAIYWYRCQECDGLSKQVWALVKNDPTAG